jgi:aminoglycoside phosphotransferase (APT) family kinase protein
MSSKNKMHAGEIDIDVALVSRMIASQFPQWAKLPIIKVDSAGTDNAMYWLGNDMVIRLPRIHWAIEQVEKEHQWLPKLAPKLPLTIPTPLAKGKPDDGYPWHWSVYKWIDGENATIDRLKDKAQAAKALAQFIATLQSIDATNGPSPGSHNSNRGIQLAARDAHTRDVIHSLKGSLDIDTATAAWEAALNAPVYQDTPVWIHGDIQSSNLLAVEGRINAVIDFGCLGIGDPACDLMVAWNLFSVETREVFRKTLSVDDATWTRGCGWALSVGLIALPYYAKTNLVLAKIAQYTIDEVLADYKRS